MRFVVWTECVQMGILVFKVPPLTEEEQEARDALCSSIAALNVQVRHFKKNKNFFYFFYRNC